MPIGFPKPVSRKTLKQRERQTAADRVAAVRVYVFGRERDICRCCRIRRADSMHELRPRSLGGRVSHGNSVAVCGSGTTGCHGFLQSHQIDWHAKRIIGADGPLEFRAATKAAADHLRVTVGQWILSDPMSCYEGRA